MSNSLQPVRDRRERKGAEHPLWAGGRKVSTQRTKMRIDGNPLLRMQRRLSQVRSSIKKIPGCAPLESVSAESVLVCYENTEGACEICGQNELVTGRALHLDHSHATGKIRGFLCSKCNQLLGLASDNPDILWKATMYLGRTSL